MVHTRHEAHPTHLVVVATGSFDLESAAVVAREAIDAAQALGVEKILVDCRSVAGTLSTIERFAYANLVAERHARYLAASGRHLRVAYVGREPLIDPERFTETVAVNRGALVKMTTDLEEALAWLGVSAAQAGA
jgi:hypothetical protein